MRASGLSILIALALFAGGPLELAVADAEGELDKAAAGPSLRFRRIHAPLDAIDKWPTGGDFYVPVLGKDFEQRLQALNDRHRPQPAAGGISQAIWRARLEQRTLSGTTEWKIQRPAEEVGSLSLGPTNLALRRLQWQNGSPSPRPSSAAPAWGADPAGNVTIVVDRDEQIAGEWSRTGELRDDGEIRFSLRLPAAHDHQLLLDLPIEVKPHAAGALVELVPTAAELAGRRVWRILCGGQTRLELAIRRTNSAPSAGAAPDFQQSTTYDFSSRGLQVNVELSIRGEAGVDGWLECEIDDSLQPLWAKVRQSDVDWTLHPSDHPGKAKLRIELIDGRREVREQIQIRFLAPLPLEKAAALPAVELPEPLWRQSSITLLIPRPLLLQRLDLEGCIQTSRESYPGMTAGEVVTLQAFDPRPRVEALVGRVASLPAIASGVSYTLGRRDVTATMIADCSLAAGEAFELEAAVGEDWLVETVESDPPGAIANWSQQAAAGGGSRLVVRLERALSAERGHRLVLAGRWRRSPVHSTLRINDLRFASFTSTCAVDTVIRIQADAKLEASLQDASGSEQGSGNALSAAEASRLSGTGGILLQLDADDGAEGELHVAEREPRFRADLRVHLLVEDETIRERFDIECEPVASDVDRLLVHLSTARDAPVQWFEEHAESSRPLTCRKLSESERAALGRDVDGETWRIELDRPRQKAFHIRGTTRGPLPDRMTATLAAVHGATEQSGTLVVASNASRLPTIMNQRLRPLPLKQFAAAESEPLLARFRYEPESDLNNPRARVTVSRGERLLAESFVWRMLLDSRYSVGGEAMHRMQLRVQQQTRRHLTFSLPPHARPYAASASGRPIACEPAEGVNSWKLDLAAAAGLVDVVVDFRTSGEPLGLSQSLSCPRLELDVPVLDAAWRVWTPLSYEPRRSESGAFAESASWRKRLFGPAGRAPNAEIFNPLSQPDWREFAAPDTSLTRASEQALAWLTILQSQLGEQESDQLAALLLAMPSPDTDAPPLYVDMAALDRDGLGPRTTLSLPAEDESPRRALALLERNGLALIVLPEGLLLTTAARYAEWKPELIALSEGKVAWMSSGAPRLFDRPVDGDASNHAWCPPAAAFAKLASTTPQSPTAAEAHNQPKELFTYVQTSGWNVAVVPLSSTDPTTIQVVRIDYLKTAAWVLWLFIAVSTYWLLPARWVGWIAMLAISAATALLLPEPVSRFATALFLGTLVGLLSRWITRRPWRFAPAASDKTSVLDGSTQRASVVGTAVWLAIWLAPIHAVAGDTPMAQPAADEDPIYRVFIPTDEDDLPAGDKYFIPQAMFRELFRKPQAATADLPTIFQSARYEGKLAWDAARRTLEFDEFLLQWDIRTAGSETIDLPLTPAAFQSAEWEIHLNGESVEPISDDAGGMRLRLPDAGVHLLSIRGLPVVSEQAGRQVAALSIPRIPDAELSLSLPADAPAVHVDSALGASRRTESSGRLTAELGPTDRLVVSWQPAGARGGEALQTNGSQLVSLHVRSGSVVVESQLRLQLGDRALDRMRFSVDPRLRLLPDEADSPRIRQSTHNEPGVLELVFEEPLRTDQTLRLRFLLTDATGIGRMQLPELRPLEVRLLDRFLAVYVEENLAFETNISEAARPITPGSLAPDWGVDAENPPRTAYQLPLGAADWSLTTRPRAARVVGDGRLHVRYGLAEIDIHYEAQLASQGGYLFQYQWRVPPALQVHHASVKQDDLELVDRWAVTADGLLTLFLKQAVTGSQDVVISGSLPDAKANGEIPVVVLSEAQSPPGAILLYRTSEVALRVEPGEHFRMQLDAAPEPKPEFGVLVATLETSGEPRLPSTPPQPGRVVVTPNHPRVSAEQTTVLDRVSNRWRAETRLNLRIEDGFRDGLRLRVPAAWTEEIEVSPAMGQQVVDLPDEKDQLVILTPQQPLEGEVDLRVVLRMRTSSRDRVHAPNVTLLDTDSNARYLLLPKQVDLQPVTWDVEGVRRETLPRRPIDAPLSDDSFLQYRVVADSFDAALKRLERTAGVAQIWLMDVELVVPDDSPAATGRATFDLDPAGLTACRIEVPSQVSLLDLTIDGQPAPLRSVAEGMLELNLNSDELTQRIAITFQVETDANDRSTLAVPSLWTEQRPIDVERTLWTVRGMAALQRLEAKSPTEPANQPSAFDLQAERLRSLGLLLSNRAADEPSPALMAWLNSWNGWLEQEIHRAEWLLEMEPEPHRDRAPLAQVIASLRRQRDAVRAELEADGVVSGFAPGATQPTRHDPLSMFDHRGPEARAMFHGDVTTLLGRRPAVARPPIPPATLLACMLLAGGLALVWFRKQLDLGDAVQRWAHAWGVVIGLLYWLLLWPSVFGLLIVFVSLLLALLPRWPRVRLRDASLTTTRQ